MNRIDLIAVRDAIEDAQAELEQLMIDEEWYVTEVTERLHDAATRVREALGEVRPTPTEEDGEEW